MPIEACQRPSARNTPSRQELDSSGQQPKDHWTSSAYNASASFVPALAQEIVQWLDPRPTDIILDLGCGDGTLTANIAQKCRYITGFDASPNLIEAAVSTYGDRPNIGFQVYDCRHLEESENLQEEQYHKIFSNAALHWILRDQSSQTSVFRAVYLALKTGGKLVFEMGGAGNVADVHTALLAALVHQGVSFDAVREADPWFFPSEQSMKIMLEDAGFRIVRIKTEYRPTKLTTTKEGGLPGWVRLMGAQFLEILDSDAKKEAVVKEVCDVLKTVLNHDENGNMSLGYVRLRVIARK